MFESILGSQIKVHVSLACRIALRVQGNVHGEYIPRLHAEVLVFKVAEALKQQAGAGEQHHARGYLCGHQEPPQPGMGRGPALLSYQVGYIWPLKCGYDAEDGGADERE